MSRKKDYRKIGVTGKTNSYFVIIPKDIIRDLNWRKGQRVVIEQRKKTIVIRDWVP
ncbi:MAG: AbrB/MazE/SpoVT family DNA-binding domain-containing protein [Candidatus Omnitrophica bacterium]|nr:AbrB/MazE/SpoVT family DNA-binding domain-containing protein [Candidatus Omnitrophota bacterium]